MSEELGLKKFLDSKFPLLERFREMAPGSFKHCKNVASFCESIALKLKLDVDILLVAAQYHDIGKTNYPEAFSENQNGTNVHENIDPILSYQILTRHVGDSVLMLLDVDDMPPKVLNIISQHHGSTVLQFFHKKALEKNSSVSPDLFRYKCSPPQCIEGAVLMICDSVEATARALSAANELQEPEDRRGVVDATIKRLMDDDQLDDMKVGELKNIKRVLCKELENVYHKREIYGGEKTVKEVREEGSDIDID